MSHIAYHFGCFIANPKVQHTNQETEQDVNNKSKMSQSLKFKKWITNLMVIKCYLNLPYLWWCTQEIVYKADQIATRMMGHH